MQPGMNVGPYRILEQVGLGGMATIFKAYDPGTDRYVAIKIVSPQFATHPEFRERFRREAKSIARLEHPHIIPVHAFGEEGDTAYLVLRYMDTGTLRDRMNAHPLEMAEAVDFVHQIAGALDYAHRNGVIHRDVKPSNVLVDSEGHAYLTDFGIAKIVEATVELTGTGTAMGTPQYMSPEQCRGDKDLTAATDIYSLGVILYQMLTGRPPFEAETPLAVIQMHLNSPLPPPREVNPEIPEAVERVLLKALAKEPEDRHKSAADFSDKLREALRSVEAAAAPERPSELVEPESRQPTQAASQPELRAAERARTVDPQPSARAGGADTSLGRPITGFLRRYGLIGTALLALIVVGILVVPGLLNGVTQDAELPEIEGVPEQAPAEPTEQALPEIEGFPDQSQPADGDPGGIDCMGAAPGEQIRLFHQWAADREGHFSEVIDPLVAECELQVSFESVPAGASQVGEHIEGGDVPQVVIWSDLGALRPLNPLMSPLHPAGAHPENYALDWIEWGSAPVGPEGSVEWLAVPLTVTPKSLIWYSPAEFESRGYPIPHDFGELEQLVERMADDGEVPWSMGQEAGEFTGWVGSDFVQELLQVYFGPDIVRGIVEGHIPYDVDEVAQAYDRYLGWASNPRYTVDGTDGTLSIHFMDSIRLPFSEPPEAMMVYAAGWAGGEINRSRPDLEAIGQIDFFRFPGSEAVQAGAEWLTVFNPTPAAQAMVAYLTSAEGGVRAAELDFGVSPNRHAVGAHPDPYANAMAHMLAEAERFAPDLGDTIAGEFAAAEWNGIVDALNGVDLGIVLSRIAEAQAHTLTGD